jgi:alpha-1,4-digalacturonate transport system substrate-binding protein
MQKLSKLLTLMVLALAGLASAQKSELSILWMAAGSGDQAIFDRYVKLYEQQNPNVSVNVSYVALPQLAQRLQLMIAGKTAPDVARVTTSTIAEFAPLAADLTGTVDPNDFMPTQVPYIRVNRRVVGAPLDITVTALYYNKDCFEQAGIKVPTNISLPWTLDDWKAAMVQVTQKSRCRFGLAWEPTTHRFSSLFYAAGGRYINTSGSRFVIDSPESLRALTFFQSLFKENLTAKGVWLSGEDATSLFKSGLTGMFMATNGHIPLLQPINNFKWGVLPMPMDKIRSTNPGGTFLMGFKEAKNPAEGAKFIKWLTSKEIAAQYAKDFTAMSPRRDLQDLKYGAFDDEYAIFRNDLKVSPSATGQDGANPAMAKINTFVREQIVKMLLDQQTPKQTLEAINAEGTKFLGK